MTSGTDVSVAPQGDGRFRVEVRESGVSTNHTVEVPRGLADSIGWGTAGEAELVRESFAFLLEREPATSILSRFSLDVIGQYFPEYPTEIRRRLQDP
jgi:hypothetical protein